MNDQFVWPTDARNKPLAVAFDPVLEINMCFNCWNRMHKRGGCQVPACQCGCYAGGRNKGLGKVKPPVKGCKENQSFPDVGSFAV